MAMKERKRIKIEDLETTVAYKKFVRLNEGAKLYSIGLNTFRELAKDAGAIYKVRKIVLVNTEILDEFLEAFHEENGEGEY